MNDTEKALVGEATSSLRLINVNLGECQLRRPTELPSEKDSSLGIQLKRLVSYGVDVVEDASDVLVIKVSLGVRLIDKDVEDTDTAPIYIEIEADYLVLYSILSELSEDALETFSNFNGVHNVWPFWRQHVFDLVGRARLPHIEVPLFPGDN